MYCQIQILCKFRKNTVFVLLYFRTNICYNAQLFGHCQSLKGVIAVTWKQNNCCFHLPRLEMFRFYHPAGEYEKTINEKEECFSFSDGLTEQRLRQLCNQSELPPCFTSWFSHWSDMFILELLLLQVDLQRLVQLRQSHPRLLPYFAIFHECS